ncbi:hypothetical protein DMB90_08765 [Raoultella planticola]|uniref:Uncharacterized protein n=1 Tax=Raoultella planticola TaxID=575 RepID=A0A5P6A9L5_RAOPL|nr:hypothetical protein DMB90_08765 [Raoultella planticola]
MINIICATELERLRYPEGTPTQLADIFFIFTVNSSETTTALDLWRNYCAGDNVFLATNYRDIINVLTGIAKKSSVKFINKMSRNNPA